MSNLTEEEQLRAERLRKKNLQNFIMNQNRLASQAGKSFNGNQLVNNHYQSYQNDGYGQSNSSRKDQRYLPRIAQNRKSYDLDDVHRDRYGHDKYENDKTEVYLKNCEEIIKNLRQLKQKKKAMDQRRLATQLYSPKQHTRSQSYGGSPNRNFSSQGTPYNKVLPPLNDYRTPIARSRQYGFDSGQRQRQKSRNYHIRNNSHSLSHRNNHSNSVPLQQHSRQAIRQDTEMPQGFNEDATPSESNSKASSTRKQNSNRMEDQLVKQKEQFNECIVELTKFLKQQNNSRVEQNSASTSRVEHENREEFQPQNGNKSYRKKQTIEGDTLELIPQTHNQDNNENSQEADEVQKQKIGTLIEATITALKQLKDKKQHKTHENSKNDRRINKDNLSRASQNKINEKTMQSQIDLDTSKSHQQSLSKDPLTQADKKNELLNLLMKHIQKQDSKNDELSFCLKELTNYLKDQNHELEEIKNSRHNRYEDEVVNEFPEEFQQKTQEQPKINNQKDQKINTKQENQKKKVKQNIQNNSNIQPTQPTHQNQTAISQSSPEVQNAIIKNLKKARLRGSLFSQKLSSFKKQHTKMNYFLSNKEDSSRNNEPPNEPNQQNPSNN